MNGPFLTLKFQSSLIINHNKSALLSPLPLLFSASSLFIYTRFSFGRMIDAQVWLFSLRLDWKGLIFNGIVCHLKTFSFAKNGTCVHTSWSKRGLKSSLSVLLFAHSYSDRELHSGLKCLVICTKINVDYVSKSISSLLILYDWNWRKGLTWGLNHHLTQTVRIDQASKGCKRAAFFPSTTLNSNRSWHKRVEK